MFGLILIILLGVIFMGLFGTYIYLHYKDNKNAGPMPWHPAYDLARVERLEREARAKAALKKSEVKVQPIQAEDYL